MIITEEKPLVQKLLDKDEITREDIQSLHLFGADYIDRLIAAGQETTRQKVAEALLRDRMVVIE